jgi:hypothetical protein
MNIDHISVSRKDCFDLCPAQYKFRYHSKIKSPFPEPEYFSYGRTVHKIAELYIQGQGEKTLMEITQLIFTKQIPIEERFGTQTFAPNFSPEYKERLPEHLRAIDRIAKLTGFTGLTEFAFEYDLDPPNNCLINGVIDRLIEKKNKYWIIDYKTTKRGIFRKTPTTITKDLQLRCYARVVQKQYNAPAENIQCALFYLEGGDLIGARFSESSLLDVEQQLLQTYHKIKNMDPNDAKGNIGQHCRRCDYRTLCPHYKAKGK